MINIIFLVMIHEVNSKAWHYASDLQNQNSIKIILITKLMIQQIQDSMRRALVGFGTTNTKSQFMAQSVEIIKATLG